LKVHIFNGDDVSDTKEMMEIWREEFAGNPEIEYEFKGRFSPKDPDRCLGDADAVLGAFIVDGYFSDELLERYPNLKYVSTFAHGFGKIDADAARKHNVTFTNTIYGDYTIAQYTFAMLLDICHNIRAQDALYKKRLTEHIPAGPENRLASKQIGLCGKTLGIIGVGNIGYRLAKMAEAFGMNVIAYDIVKKTEEKYRFIRQVDMDELLKSSDVISIHCALTDDTRNLLDSGAFNRMKDGVIILNAARGAIIDEEALAAALRSGKVYMAGLDVVAGEPLTERIPLMDCDNAIITAHIAWLQDDVWRRTIRLAASNFKNWLSGRPVSVIAP